ncbi:hypothetical protein ACRE_007840 [Hapsidospora chrysogenum ATCC 11550]|uniref:BTB domain-containing protein n=1 Tax=Hapsidospora chrysogenum (strain ATCC 11550 / CBS 779.69 / DSM 880 / IAM 14645 / JCM 23072 / IMI 49137) TaxID=857340 RepID=A0A086TG17_HAPC1|nr:hypothetical protein ACRE_007840 [Hapsidospora chrysogenum ATCC 11550]
MVSQPETSSSLSLRGATSSVVSRPALSRTKRYNRSHAGGTSSSSSYAAAQNEFPVFSHSGDVEITIRAGPVQNRYLLHRHTLTRCSGFFEASTSDEWSKARPLLAGGNELARIGEDDAAAARTPTGSVLGGDRDGSVVGTPRKRWRYELDPGDGDGDIPMLVQKDDSRDSHPSSASIFGGPDTTRSASHVHSHSRSKGSHSRSASTTSNRDFFRSVTNLSLDRHHRSSSSSAPPLSKSEHDLLRDYDNLFRTMYNYPPVLDGVNVADAYVQCKSLLNLADQYDALGVVGPRVDHHLLQFQSRLWKQIAKYPISYLRLGYLARSKVIFQEALIHVVGQWPSGERSLRAALPETVLDIIEDKVDELEETVSRVEGRLFRLSLTTPRGERVAPDTSYLDWLAVSLFRQWLADNTSPQPPPPPLPPPSSSSSSRRPARERPPLPPAVPPLTSVGRAYRTLGSPNPASYLDHDECKRFLKLTPDLYSRENLRRFERRMDELKGMARDLVRPLMGSGLELDLSVRSGRASDDLGYLTCTAVGNRDLPWAVED